MSIGYPGHVSLAERKIFLAVGLFDEKIFMYMDEIDFLYRAKRKGYSIVYNPFARFIHVGSRKQRVEEKLRFSIFIRGFYIFTRNTAPHWPQGFKGIFTRKSVYGDCTMYIHRPKGNRINL